MEDSQGTKVMDLELQSTLGGLVTGILFERGNMLKDRLVTAVASEHRVLTFGQRIDRDVVSGFIEHMFTEGSVKYLESGDSKNPYVQLSREEEASLTKIGGTD